MSWILVLVLMQLHAIAGSLDGDAAQAGAIGGPLCDGGDDDGVSLLQVSVAATPPSPSRLPSSRKRKRSVPTTPDVPSRLSMAQRKVQLRSKIQRTQAKLGSMQAELAALEAETERGTEHDTATSSMVPDAERLSSIGSDEAGFIEASMADRPPPEPPDGSAASAPTSLLERLVDKKADHPGRGRPPDMVRPNTALLPQRQTSLAQLESTKNVSSGRQIFMGGAHSKVSPPTLHQQHDLEQNVDHTALLSNNRSKAIAPIPAKVRHAPPPSSYPGARGLGLSLLQTSSTSALHLRNPWIGSVLYKYGVTQAFSEGEGCLAIPGIQSIGGPAGLPDYLAYFAGEVTAAQATLPGAQQITKVSKAFRELLPESGAWHTFKIELEMTGKECLVQDKLNFSPDSKMCHVGLVWSGDSGREFWIVTYGASGENRMVNPFAS